MTAEALEPPDDLLELKMSTRLLTESEGTMTGEGVAWHAAWRAGSFLQGARQTGDAAYLDAAVTYFDALIAKLHTSPDGYRGWVGPYIYDESVIGDVHIGDAILVNPMLDFVLYVTVEQPDLGERYGDKAAEYTALAEHICTKWDDRGTWYENGYTGGYYSWDHYLSVEGMDEFQVRDEVRNSGLSLPFNKQQSMAIIHLRLHRLTGNVEHLRRARLIFQTTRSRMSAYGEQFTWNYWEPQYPGDVVSVEPPELAHWVGTHPYRDYQQGEVSEFVEAYHSGLVFSRADMERLVRTNLSMWNGDRSDPDWVNSDVAANRAAAPDWEMPDPSAHGYPRLAGTLWRALAPFDDELAQLAGMTADDTGYERHTDLPVQEFDWDTPQVTYLNMACALPVSVAAGDTVLLVGKTRAAGDLRVVVMDAGGPDVLETLFAGGVEGGVDGIEGIAIQAWPADVAPGDYRVRWTFERDGHREHRDVRVMVE